MLRTQLDGLGMAIEFSQNALNRSQNVLEEREKALNDALSSLKLKEVICVTYKNQLGKYGTADPDHGICVLYRC